MSTLQALLAHALAAVEAGGPAALAVVMLLENLFPPVPSEAVLPLAGFAVTQQRLSFAVAVSAATAGSVAGAWVLYAAGRFGGRPLLHRWEWLLRLDDGQLDRADAWFDHHGGRLVLWARMVPLARSVVSVPAGMSHMPFWRFTTLTVGGSLLWNVALISAGMLLGSRWRQASAVVDRFGWVVLSAGALAVIALLLRARTRARLRART